MMVLKCALCGSENKIQYSHNIPCYLFFLESKERKERQKNADQYGLTPLCENCHKKYERELRDLFIKVGENFYTKKFNINIVKELKEDWVFICKYCGASLDIEDEVCPYCNTKREEGENV